MCRYYRENLHVNYFLELKGQLSASRVFFHFVFMAWFIRVLRMLYKMQLYKDLMMTHLNCINRL